MYTETGCRRYRFSVAWFASFLSLFMLVWAIGAVSAALFIFPWIVLVIRAPQLALAKTIENAPLFLLPAVALLSTAWSQYPEVSLRTSVEYFLTVEISILAGSLVNPRTFLSALLTALTVIMIIGLAIDGGESFRGGEPLIGLFPSKNQLGFHTVMLLIVALTVVFDKLQSVLARLIALFAFLLVPVCLAGAQSAGAIVFGIPAIIASTGLIAVRHLPVATRITVIAAVIITSIAAIIIFAGFADFGVLLEHLGKDSTLTGRVYLWQTARGLIGQSPILGLGYQAVWQVGNPVAEDLWAASFEPSGAGFNFHNLYLNTAVELGFVGLGALLLTFFALGIRLLRSVILRPSPPVCFAVAVYIFLCSNSFVEVTQLYPFYLGTVLLGIMWAYSGAQPLYPYGKILTPVKRNAMPL